MRLNRNVPRARYRLADPPRQACHRLFHRDSPHFAHRMEDLFPPGKRRFVLRLHHRAALSRHGLRYRRWCWRRHQSCHAPLLLHRANRETDGRMPDPAMRAHPADRQTDRVTALSSRATTLDHVLPLQSDNRQARPRCGHRRLLRAIVRPTALHPGAQEHPGNALNPGGLSLPLRGRMRLNRNVPRARHLFVFPLRFFFLLLVLCGSVRQCHRSHPRRSFRQRSRAPLLPSSISVYRYPLRNGRYLMRQIVYVRSRQQDVYLRHLFPLPGDCFSKSAPHADRVIRRSRLPHCAALAQTAPVPPLPSLSGRS